MVVIYKYKEQRTVRNNITSTDKLVRMQVVYEIPLFLLRPNIQRFPFIRHMVSVIYSGDHTHFPGHAVTQLVEALGYKPESRGFVSRWFH